MSVVNSLREFFAYEYLGIAIIDNSDSRSYYNCVSKAIERAYKDAALMGAYNALIGKNNQKLKSISEKAKAEAADQIKDKIINLANGKPCMNKKEFGDWHKDVCNKIYECYKKVNKFDNKERFTYGNAQKWINMTLKYLWLIDMLPKSIDSGVLHAPIDSYILQKLKKCGVDGVSGSDSSYYYKRTTWSNLEISNYEQLQKEIESIAEKEGLSVIEWENKAWIESATERKKQS